MSLLSVGVLTVNLAGEVLYVLGERLRAQGLGDDKVRRVLSRVVRALAGPTLVSRLLSPSSSACDDRKLRASDMRALLARLCRCSGVRLDGASLRALAELAATSLKWQTLSSCGAQSLRTVTDAHLAAMERAARAAGDDGARSAAAALRAQLALEFTRMCAGDAAALRSALLRFLQDRRAVVAAFVADGRQLAETGAAAYIQSGPLPPGAELPGAVRFFNTAGQRTREERFDPGLPRYCLADEPALPLGADTFAPLRIPQQQNPQPTAVAVVTVSPPTPSPPPLTPPTSVAPASPLQLRPPKPPSVPAPAAPLSKLRVLPPKPRVAPPAVPATKKHPPPAPPSSSPPHALLSLLPTSPSPASAEAQAAIDELAALASFVPSTSKAAAATAAANAGNARSAASDTPPDLASLAQSLMALGDPSLLSEQPESPQSSSSQPAAAADLSALSSAAAALDGLGAHQFGLPETSKTPQAAPQQAVDDLLALMDQAAQLDL